MMYYVSHNDGAHRLDRFKTVVLMLLVALLLPVLWYGRVDAGREQAVPSPAVNEPAHSPPPVSIDAPSDGSTVQGDSVTVIGTATPGQKLEMLVNGKSTTTLTAAVDGGWRYDLPMSEPGDYRIVMRMVATDGSEKANSAPIIVTRLPELRSIATPSILEPGTDAVLSGDSVQFKGKGEPGREVVLVIDGKEVGKTTIANDGNWTMNASVAVADHDVHAYTLDENGNALMSASQHMAVRPTNAAAASASSSSATPAPAANSAVAPTANCATSATAAGCEKPTTAADVAALTDQDEDGVADADDKCSQTPKGMKVNDAGCPTSGQTLLTLTGLTFENNTTDMTPESKPALEKAVAVLKENASLNVLIVGHTDDRGDPDYNRDLSKQRAEAVRQYLIGQGVAAGRLEAVGKGEDEPLVPNTNDRARKQNRRVEMVVK
jgi:OOP family OmpA-OmpF porin